MRVAGRSICFVILALALAALDLTRSGMIARAGSRSTAAQHSGIQMHIDAGFSGNYRPEAWVPVRVRVSNTGPQFVGTLRIDDTGQQATFGTAPTDRTAYTRSVLLPTGGVKLITLYVPGADLGSSITIRLDGNAPVLPQTITVNSLNLGRIFAGVLSRNSVTYTQLATPGMLDAAALPVRLDAATLDSNPLALASFDLIVLNDFNSGELSGDQLAALETWVRGGGTLVEIGGPTAQTTISPLPTALQIVRPGQPLTLSRLPGLAAAGGNPIPPGQYVAATGQIAGGTTVLTQQQLLAADGVRDTRNVPLVVTEPLGLGTVVFSAIDPTQGSLAVWRGVDRYWKLLTARVLSDHATATTEMAGTQQSTAQSSGIAQEIDNLSAPSFTLFVALLALYVLVLVPLNFLVLGRLRRRDLSWLTLPAVVVILVAFTFGSAYFGRGRNVRTSVVSMVYLTSGASRVMVQQYVGLFAPMAGDYTIASDDVRQLGTSLFSSSQSSSFGGGGTPALGLEFNQDSAQVRMPAIHMWSARNAVLVGPSTYRGRLDSAIHVDARGHFIGTLTNNTGANLSSVVLMAPGTIQSLGNIAAGKTVAIDLQSAANSGSASSPQSLSDFYSNATAALVPVPADRRNVALADQRHVLASINADLLGVPAARLLADSVSIVTNPDESLPQRLQRISAQFPIDASPFAYGTLLAIGWSAQPVGGFTVNGGQVGRQDTDMLVQPLAFTVPDGPFHLNPGTVPVRLSGSNADLTQGGYTNGGFTINGQSDATFVGQLPLPSTPGKALHITSLTVDVNQSANIAGGSLTSTSMALYNWRTGSWVSVDATSGEVTPKNPARFVNAAGQVRVRLDAQDSSINISDQNTGITIGAAGDAR